MVVKIMSTHTLFSPRMSRSILILLAALLPALPLAAQTNSSDWYTISGGGGVSTGGVYTLTSVIGQPAANQLSGGNYQVQGGFLAAVGLVQTAGMPRLSLSLTNGQARVSWPRPADGCALEKTTTLSGSPIPWGGISGAYQTNAAEVFVLEPLTPGKQFFRLKR
jgi:hypothetical protein